jgi:hypothetical protein
MLDSSRAPARHMIRRITLFIIFKMGNTISQPLAWVRSYPLAMNPLNALTNTAKNNIKDFSNLVLGRSTNAWYMDNTSPAMKTMVAAIIRGSYSLGETI